MRGRVDALTPVCVSPIGGFGTWVSFRDTSGIGTITPTPGRTAVRVTPNQCLRGLTVGAAQRNVRDHRNGVASASCSQVLQRPIHARACRFAEIDNKRHAIPSRDDGSLKALQGSITMRGLQNDVRVANRTASREAGACLLPESVAYCCTHRAGDPLP